LVNLLVQGVALAAQNTVPVLHAKRDASEAVVILPVRFQSGAYVWDRRCLTICRMKGLFK
jgi:hypothetical protein